MDGVNVRVTGYETINPTGISIYCKTILCRLTFNCNIKIAQNNDERLSLELWSFRPNIDSPDDKQNSTTRLIEMFFRCCSGTPLIWPPFRRKKLAVLTRAFLQENVWRFLPGSQKNSGRNNEVAVLQRGGRKEGVLL